MKVNEIRELNGTELENTLADLKKNSLTLDFRMLQISWKTQ